MLRLLGILKTFDNITVSCSYGAALIAISTVAFLGQLSGVIVVE